MRADLPVVFGERLKDQFGWNGPCPTVDSPGSGYIRSDLLDDAVWTMPVDVGDKKLSRNIGSIVIIKIKLTP